MEQPASAGRRESSPGQSTTALINQNPRRYVMHALEVINQSPRYDRLPVAWRTASIFGKSGNREACLLFYEATKHIVHDCLIPEDREKGYEEMRKYLRLFPEESPSDEWSPPAPRDGVIDFSYMKQVVASMPPGELHEMPLTHRLMLEALRDAADEKEFVLKMRFIFYRLTPEERYGCVWAAFDDPSPQFAPLRQLLAELPESQQQRILSGTGGPEC